MSIFGLKTKPSSPQTVTWKSKVYEITSISVISSVCNEWDCLKAFVLPLITGVDLIDYLEIWPKLLKNKDVQASCNVLHIIELFLITPFTNAKLKRMFSRLNRVKTDYCNRLGQERLKHLLRIGEEGQKIEEFDADAFMGFW